MLFFRLLYAQNVLAVGWTVWSKFYKKYFFNPKYQSHYQYAFYVIKFSHFYQNYNTIFRMLLSTRAQTFSPSCKANIYKYLCVSIFFWHTLPLLLTSQVHRFLYSSCLGYTCSRLTHKQDSILYGKRGSPVVIGPPECGYGPTLVRLSSALSVMGCEWFSQLSKSWFRMI